MANKTIYVSNRDEELFDQAKELAGEGLSSVISQALREYVGRQQERQKGMKEISVKTGPSGSAQEQRFVGQLLGKWQGFSNDKQWFQQATIYLTQKGNWAVYLVTISKASLLTDRKQWKKSGDYLINSKAAELLVAKAPDELNHKLPAELLAEVQSLAKTSEKPVEYLDI